MNSKEEITDILEKISELKGGFDKTFEPLITNNIKRMMNPEDFSAYGKGLVEECKNKIWKGFPTCKEEIKRPEAFISKIIKNTVIDWYRKGKIKEDQRFISLDGLEKGEKEEIEAELAKIKPSHTPEDKLMESERKEVISEILTSALKELVKGGVEGVIDAIIISLYYGKDHRYKEIGELLELEENTVNQRHIRALKKLQKLLKPLLQKKKINLDDLLS